MLKGNIFISLVSLLILGLGVSCRTQNKMFQIEKSSAELSQQLESAEKNYLIHANDYLDVMVYTNNGERLIDPNFEIRQETGTQQEPVRPRYLVKENGLVNLPMVGEVELKGLSIPAADSLLSIKYSEFYEDVFVITKVLTRRVIVLGPLGGKVLPLENEEMNVIEVLALYGGLGETGIAHNIRLIRGDLNNPEVSIIDLSTIDGMKKASLKVNSQDIIYIESRKKTFSETARDLTPFVAIFGNIIALVVLLSR